MAATEAVVKDWGGLALTTQQRNTLQVRLNNAVGALAHGDFAGERAAYLETLHDLTHAPWQVLEVWPGETTQAGFEAKLAARTGSPVRVLYAELDDAVNGGSNTYWWSDVVVADVDTLYSRPAFTGHLDSWTYSLNELVLELTGTERSDHTEVPERLVTLTAWPNTRAESEGEPYPEVWGSPGAALDSDKLNGGIGSVPAVLVDRPGLRYVAAGHALTSIAGETGLAELSLDGLDDRVDLPNSALINTGGPYEKKTVEVRFRTGSDVATRQVLYEEGGGTNGINLYLDSGSLYAGAWSDNDGWTPAFTSTAISADTLYTAALVLDTTVPVLRLYVDGSLASSTAITGVSAGLSGHGGLCALGAKRQGTSYHDGDSGADGQYFTGELLWCRHWNEVARTQPELDGSKTTRRLPKTAGLVAQWCLDEGGGRTALDSSGNGLDGVIRGAAWTPTVPLWVAVPGYSEGYGYVEGCSVSLEAADHEGAEVAAVGLPAVVLARLYVPTLAVGSYAETTATSPDNLTGRDASSDATLAAGQFASMAVVPGLEGGRGAAIQRVWIAVGTVDSDLRVRWAGPSSSIVGTGADYIAVDSVAGWDDSGKVAVTSGVYDYTSVTTISASEHRLNISGYAGSDTGAATMCGAWQTVNDTDMEVTGQRDWTSGDLYKMELQLENTHGSNSHDVPWLGFRVELELTGYPAVYVPCEGAGVTFRSTDYGASRNPALIMEDLHTRVLGLPESRIGTTFDSMLTLLGAWRFDIALVRQRDSEEVLRELARQARAFTWRDGEDDVQLGVYRLGDAAELTLTEAADLIDGEGDGLVVEQVPVEEVYNRVHLRWGYDYARGEAAAEYHITEDSSNPTDTARVQAAADSQARLRLTRTLNVEAPWIQDSATALALLQWLFDWHHVRRHRVRFAVPEHVNVRAGTILKLSHTVVPDADVNYLAEAVVRRGDRREVTAISLSLEALYADTAGFEVQADYTAKHLWGSPGFWDPWGGSTVAGESSVTGRVVDYGLALWAQRLVEDTTEKPSHGAIGSGDAAAAASDLTLGSQHGARVSPESVSRTGPAVTWVYAVTAVTAGLTLREMGLFSGATGSTLLARVVLAADVAVPEDATVRVTLTVTLKRPTAGSALTDYGLDLWAQRLTEDTAEKPTHYAVGTDDTAEAPSDTALGAQISDRQAFAAGYPRHDGSQVEVATAFAAASYGGNTVRELAVHTGATGGNAILRRVPTEALVIDTGEDATVRHQVVAAHYS